MYLIISPGLHFKTKHIVNSSGECISCDVFFIHIFFAAKCIDFAMKCGLTCGAITGGLMVLGDLVVENPYVINQFRRRIADNHNGMTDCAARSYLIAGRSYK